MERIGRCLRGPVPTADGDITLRASLGFAWTMTRVSPPTGSSPEPMPPCTGRSRPVTARQHWQQTMGRSDWRKHETADLSDYARQVTRQTVKVPGHRPQPPEVLGGVAVQPTQGPLPAK